MYYNPYFEETLQKIDETGPIPEREPDRQIYFVKKMRKLVKEKSDQLGRPLTCFPQTFGCQMNARDSEKLLGILKEIGYVEASKEEEADFVFYNTCTVRENANQRVYGRLGYLNRLKRSNPELQIAMCGCMAQEPSVIETLKKSYRFVDIVFGTHNIFKLAELMYRRWTTGERVIEIWNDTNQIVEELPAQRKYAFKSGVNIMFGCNNFCSYCIVPYVRGRERSRNPEDILQEIRELVQDGVVEVMLLGQNVNSYGKSYGTYDRELDKQKRSISFAELLREVEQIEGLERIRFMTSHPKDLSDELIEVMKHSSKICRHLHLPLQSGSSRVLKAMNRHYTKEQYLALVEKIRREIPDLSLTTDIIVGFPGETEEDFEETMDVVRRVRFDSAFTFLYSKRIGTPAASMYDPTPPAVIQERFERLLREVQRISAEVCCKDVGQIQKALVEGIDEKNPEFVTGRLSNNIMVHFRGDASLIGKIVEVRLEESRGFYYIGSV